MWPKIIRPRTQWRWSKNAALYIKDAAAKEALLDKAVETVKQPETLKSLSTNIAKLAFTDSANVIAREVFKLADKYRKENDVNTLKSISSACRRYRHERIGTLLPVKRQEGRRI